jgi:hypothetical protein
VAENFARTAKLSSISSTEYRERLNALDFCLLSFYFLVFTFTHVGIIVAYQGKGMNHDPIVQFKELSAQAEQLGIVPYNAAAFTSADKEL